MSQYIHYPPSGGVPTYANLAAFPATAAAGALGVALDTGVLYEYFSSAWTPISGSTTVLSIGAIDSAAPSANGAVISSNSLKLQSASATAPGLVNNASQTLSGNKTLSGQTSMSQFLTVMNAAVAGTASSPSMINTGDPNTKGLVIKAGVYNPTGFGPANPDMQNLTTGVHYSVGTLTLDSAVTTWEQACDTVQSFTGNGYVEWTVTSAGAYVGGLSTVFSASPPTKDAIDFGFYNYNSGGLSLFVIENGVIATGDFGFSFGDVLRVERSGTNILYKKNGTTLYTHAAVSAASTLFGSFAGRGDLGASTLDTVTMFYGAVVPQVENLLEVQDVNSVNLFSVDPSGNLVISGSISASNVASSSRSGRYFSSVSAISGSLATVKYATQGFDAQSAYNASTGVWTCQSAGKYQFNAAIATAGTIALNSALDIQIQQGGSASQISESLTDGAAGLTNLSGSVSDVFNCAVGDTIQVQVSSGATGPSIVASDSRNYFSWSWLGV